MKKFITSALFASLVMVAVTGCKDDEESNTDKLTDKNWKIIALTVDPPINVGGSLISDVYAQIPACSQDDLTIFKDNNTVNFDEAATKCDPNDPQTTNGTWAFNTDETVLSITEGGTVTSYTLKDLSGSEMKATFTDNSSGVVETYTVTFKAQ